MNVHHLELFYYVAKHGGISQAVRNIPYGIQQPAVSGQVLALEETLNTRLFQRRPFALTPAGRRLAEFITPFFENLAEVAAELRGEAGQRLRLAASAQALRDHVPDLLKALHRQQPLVRLFLQEAYQAEAEALLHGRKSTWPSPNWPTDPPPGSRRTRCCKLPLVLLVRQDSPVKSARDLWTQEPIRHPLVALAENQTLTRQFHEELRRRGAPVAGVHRGEFAWSWWKRMSPRVSGVGLSVQVPGKAAGWTRSCGRCR